MSRWDRDTPADPDWLARWAAERGLPHTTAIHARPTPRWRRWLGNRWSR